MRRLRILAFLACGLLVLNGCGGEKKETAENTSESSSASDSSGSGNRPKRNNGGDSSTSNVPSMGSTPANPAGGSSSPAGGGSPGGPPQESSPKSGYSGNSKADDIWAADPGPSAAGGDAAAGGGAETLASPNDNPAYGSSGGSRAGGQSSGNQMQGDPRMNNGGGMNSGSNVGNMSGDPRMNNGGGMNSGSNVGNMSGDPRMNNGGGMNSGSNVGNMSGDPRMNNNGSAGGAMRGGSGGAMRGGSGGAMRGGSGGAMRGGSGGFAGPGNQANATPTTLKEKSLAAFKGKDDAGGFQYMYGHLIAEDDGRKSIPIQFLPTVKRPRLSVRWGVGVVFKKNKGFEGAPPKIGERPNVLPQSRSRGQQGGRAGGAGGIGGPPGGFGGGRNDAGPPKAGKPLLDYYAGEVGDVLLDMLNKLRERGQFGRMIAKVDYDTNFSRNSGRGAGGPGGSSFGSGPMSVDGPGGPQFGGPGRGRNNNSKTDAASDYENVLPGVLMLGESSLKSLAGRAKAHNIDLLVVFEVYCKFVPSNGQKINETKLSIYDVTGETPVRVGKPSTTLSNIRVWLAREKNPDQDKDPIETSVKKIFQQGVEDGFLATYKIKAMPELNQGQAMNRLKSLISESQASGNPMPGLVELTYYREKGLLPEKAYVESVNKVSGLEIGDTLLNGSEEQRVKAISSLLPPEWTVNESAGGADEDVL